MAAKGRCGVEGAAAAAATGERGGRGWLLLGLLPGARAGIKASQYCDDDADDRRTRSRRRDRRRGAAASMNRWRGAALVLVVSKRCERETMGGRLLGSA
jgi:hypothetical protein